MHNLPGTAKELLPLHLVAKHGNWAQFLKRKKNPPFQKLEKTILERDGNACRFCGFTSDKYQEIVNIDHNYQNNEPGNLATACNFCAMYGFVDGICQGNKQTATLILLPELSATALNHFARVLFCCMLKDGPYKGKLLATYLSLQERKEPLEELLGPGSSNPLVFGQSILDAQIDLSKQLSHPLTQHIRLLPGRKYFKTQLEYWRQTVFSQLPL